MTRRNRSDWDVDKPHGEEAEALWRKTREAIFLGTAEVKRDDRALDTGRIYVEYECRTARGWKPSGIAITKATTWVVVFWPVVLAMPTSVLRNITRECWRDPKNRQECQRGSHPTKGVTIPVTDVLPRAIEFVTAPIGEVEAHPDAA